MMNGDSIPHNRNLSDNTLKEYAAEVLQVIKIWGMNRQDSYRLSVILKTMIQNWPKDEPWIDPLTNTGLHGDKAIEGGIMKAEPDGNFSFGEFPKKN